MKKMTICLAILVVFLFNSTGFADDYWYENITGNTSYQQTGDAVYVEGGGLNAWNHTGIFYEDDDGSLMAIEVDDTDDLLIDRISFSDFKAGHERYYGAHYNPSMSAADRDLIMEKAAEFYARRATIDYTLLGQIDWYGWGGDWDGTIDNLENVRCDGMVEVCYELNDIEVWAKNQEAGHYLIQDYPADHNNAPDLFSQPEPDTEVCPVVQRGGPGLIYTKLRATQPASTPPSKAINPSPSSGATGQSIYTDISWSNGGGATSYDVYFGTDSTPDSGEFKVSQTSTTYDPGTLSYNTTYYWRIDAKNSEGTTTGDVWYFTTGSTVPTPPSIAINPSPSSGATGQSINTDISWTNGGGATSYDVYFGTGLEFKGNQASTTYDPGTLSYNTTYIWRIDAKNSEGTTTGNIWYFNTDLDAISGVVTRDLDGQPIAGLWVYAYDYSTGNWGGSGKTQSDGTYTITGLPTGSYRVYVTIYGTDYIKEYYDNTYDYNSATPVGVILGQTTSGIDFGLAIGGKITGVVIRDSDRQLIEGLWVSANDFSTGAYGSAQTQSDGTYLITGLPTGSYRVEVNTSGTDYVREYYNNTYDYSSASPVAVTEGQTTSNIDFGLEIGGKVTGTVTRDSDGQPIEGLWVYANSDIGNGSAQTDSNGFYTIRGLLPGSYRVYVDTSGTDYVREYYNNTYDYSSASPVDVVIEQITSGVDFGLVIGGKITGTVTRDSDGEPVAGLWVQAYDYSTGIGSPVQTQSDGSYIFTGLPAGSYRVYLQTVGTDYVKEYYDNTYDYYSATPVNVTLGQTTTGIDFGLAISGKITGVVTRDSDGEPVAGLWVYANDYSTGASGNAQTQSDGSYTIAGLLTGSYRVYVQTSGTDYLREYYDNTYDSNLATPVGVTLGQTTSGIDFGLAIGGKITGVVTADLDGQPVAGLWVYANDDSTWASGSAQTQSDGTYTITGLLTGNYRVNVDNYGTDYAREYYDNTYDYSSATPVDVTVGQIISGIDFGLTIGGKITGLVTKDSDGLPIEGLWVSANDSSTGAYGSAQTQSDGTYIITSLPTGSYRVYVQTSGTYAREYYDNTYDYNSAAPVGVTLGQTTSGIDFGLAIGGKITGTVTRDSDGLPIEGLWVLAYDDAIEYWGGSETQSDGSYTITGLPPGNFKVQVDTWGTNYAVEYYNNTYYQSSATLVAVTVGQTTENIDFGLGIGGTITGTIYEADGTTPVKLFGIQITAYAGDPCGHHEYVASTWSDGNNGTYTITGLPPIEVYLRTENVFWSNEYEPNYVNEWWAEPSSIYDCDGAQSITVIPGATVSGKDFQLEEGGTISGHVYDQSGSPIQGAHIDVLTRNSETGWLEYFTASQETWFDGFYSVNVPPGAYILRAYPPIGYEQIYYLHTMDSEEAEQIQITGAETITDKDFNLGDGGVISGYVYESDGTTPISGANVHAMPFTSESGGFGDCTDQNGYFEILIAYGDYKVFADDYSGCSPAGTHIREYYNEKPSWDLSDPVTVDSENNPNLIFTLEKAADSKGDVNGDSSVDLADAILALQVVTGIEPSATVNKEADVNGDNKIGMEEVIYILQKVAGLRE